MKGFEPTEEFIAAHQASVRAGRRARLAASEGVAVSEVERAPEGKQTPARAARTAFGPVIVLPYPPSVNHFYRAVNGRMLMSAEGKKYKKEVARLLDGRGVVELAGDVCLWLDFYRPLKSGDLDNRLKVVLDSLQGIAYANDKQITEIHARRFEDKVNPRVEITIT